jgi:hypothetical protein
MIEGPASVEPTPGTDEYAAPRVRLKSIRASCDWSYVSRLRYLNLMRTRPSEGFKNVRVKAPHGKDGDSSSNSYSHAHGHPHQKRTDDDEDSTNTDDIPSLNDIDVKKDSHIVTTLALDRSTLKNISGLILKRNTKRQRRKELMRKRRKERQRRRDSDSESD